MSWQELSFWLASDEVSQFEDCLLELGALSVTLRDAADQPIMEPAPETTPLWDKLRLTAMFDSDADLQQVLLGVQHLLSLEVLPKHSIEKLEDREWRLTWMEHFKPMRFGQRLWILPSGYEPITEPNAVVVDLDPGLAFGTGSHPTTALCMTWLDAADIENKSVIDYGCGSGILAIAAAKLGAKIVTAVDNDGQAIESTNANAALNQVAHVVHSYLPDETPAETADILIANILLEPLLMLVDTLAQLVKPGGQLVLSGILHSQRDMLETAYSSFFDFTACEQQDEWIRLDATRRTD